MHKVSFVLPAYKRRFLKEAISSILAQTYRDFELVIVDDCSPENLEEIVLQFDDERLTYHRNAQNLGGRSVVAAWNHAMEYATGEWCVLASDDDVYHPRYLAEMLALVGRYPQVNLAHCRMAVIDGEGEWMALAPSRMEYESPVQFLYTRGGLRVRQALQEFIFKTAALRTIGGFVDFPAAWYSDDATWNALAVGGGVAYSSQVLFYFRNSGFNISSSSTHVKEKIDAGLMYKKWIAGFVCRLSPSDESECYILRVILSKIDSSVLMLARSVVENSSWVDWMKILLRADVAVGWKMRFVKDRVCRFLHKG